MGSVYAFQDGSGKLIKFGRSNDPEQRVKDGRTFDPRLRQLEVIEVDDAYTSKCETYLHKSLRTKRYSRELYAVTPDEAGVAMRDAWSHVHPGSEHILIPAPVMEPVGLLEKLLYGIPSV